MPGHKGLSWAVLKGAPLGSAVRALSGAPWRGRGGRPGAGEGGPRLGRVRSGDTASGSTSLRVPKACKRAPPGP